MSDHRTSTWEYRDESLVPEFAQWRAALFTIGNGYMGTRGTFEEGFEGQPPATFIQGLFVTPPGELPLLGAVPEWTGFTITVDDEAFRLDRRPPAGYKRVLDMKNGVVTRTIVWRGADTGVVRIRFRRAISMAVPGLAVLEARIESLTELVSIGVETGLDATVEGPYGALWDAESWEQTDEGSLKMIAMSSDGKHRLGVHCRVDGPDRLKMINDPSHPRMATQFTLDAGASQTITKFVHYDVAGRMADSLPPPMTTFDEVVRDSAALWALRWETSMIEVGGDPAAERALRFAAHHIIAAAPPVDTGGSIGGRLLSGYGYKHHVFWDTDMYVLPYLTLTQPDLALTHLRYRYRGLGGARRRAAEYGREGAFYAWEATDTGDDVTPKWGQMPDGERVRIRTGELQEHITADVAWAAHNYWRWTGDDDFISAFGAEMILDGAKYWAGRFEVDDAGAHLRDVIGPNEYQVSVDDSFFTNVMAAWQLRTAAEVAGFLENRDSEQLKRLEAALELRHGYRDRYRDLADKVVLHRSKSGVWEERDGFFDLEPIDLEDFQPIQTSLHGLIGDKRTRQTRLVKQADVVMALVLFEEYRTPGVLEANFDYYAPITDHGSSLSSAIYSLAASLIGRPDHAYDHFLQAVGIDHDAAMRRNGDGIHAATQGGILQAAMFGFAGLHLDRGEPQTTPRLPEHWQSLGFSFVHRGVRHERQIMKGSRSTIEAVEET